MKISPKNSLYKAFLFSNKINRKGRKCGSVFILIFARRLENLRVFGYKIFHEISIFCTWFTFKAEI